MTALSLEINQKASPQHGIAVGGLRLADVPSEAHARLGVVSELTPERTLGLMFEIYGATVSNGNPLPDSDTIVVRDNHLTPDVDAGVRGLRVEDYLDYVGPFIGRLTARILDRHLSDEEKLERFARIIGTSVVGSQVLRDGNTRVARALFGLFGYGEEGCLECCGNRHSVDFASDADTEKRYLLQGVQALRQPMSMDPSQIDTLAADDTITVQDETVTALDSVRDHVGALREEYGLPPLAMSSELYEQLVAKLSGVVGAGRLALETMVVLGVSWHGAAAWVQGAGTKDFEALSKADIIRIGEASRRLAIYRVLRQTWAAAN